jgi:glucoamylase
MEQCVVSAYNLLNWILNHFLSVTVNLPGSSTIQYKYIRKYNGGVTWESDPNRQIVTPASGTYTTDDSWR